MSKPSDLVQGTLDVLILKILALEPLHGWAIGIRLRQVSGEVLQVSEGSLYPALHKLENEGWITAEWKPTENNRRAKFYSLTRPGRRRLDKEAANWDRLSSAITGVMRLDQVLLVRGPGSGRPDHRTTGSGGRHQDAVRPLVTCAHDARACAVSQPRARRRPRRRVEVARRASRRRQHRARDVARGGPPRGTGRHGRRAAA